MTALGGAGHEGGLHAEGVGELLEQELLLDRGAAGADDGDGAGLEQVGGSLEGHVAGGGDAVDGGFHEAVVGLHLLVEHAAGIGEPGGVHRVVAARRDAVEHALTTRDGGVHADRGLGVDARRLLEEPHAHLEAEVRRGQRADRADVHRVERVIVLELLARVARERAVAAAVHEAEHVVLRDLLAEANAARTEDAALVIERDTRPELGALGLHVLLLDEARVAAAVGGGVLLELALAGLVADRAVERVVDEEELGDTLAGLTGHRRTGLHMQAGRGVGGAADLRARDPVDLRPARGRVHDRRLGGGIDGRIVALEERIIDLQRELLEQSTTLLERVVATGTGEAGPGGGPAPGPSGPT